jgi:hypothetical protein
MTATERVPYWTICHDCGAEFHTIAAETRHLEQTGHHRYELGRR